MPLHATSRAKSLIYVMNTNEAEEIATILEKPVSTTASHTTMPGGSCMVALL